MDSLIRLKELTERLKHGKHDQSSHGRRGKRGGGGGKMSAGGGGSPVSGSPTRTIPLFNDKKISQMVTNYVDRVPVERQQEILNNVQGELSRVRSYEREIDTLKIAIQEGGTRPDDSTFKPFRLNDESETRRILRETRTKLSDARDELEMALEAEVDMISQSV